MPLFEPFVPAALQKFRLIMLSSSRVPRSTVIRCPGESAAAMGFSYAGTTPPRNEKPRTSGVGFEPHLSLGRYRNSSSISRSTARGPPRKNVSGMRSFHPARASGGTRASCCLPRFAQGRSTSFFKSATSFWTSRKPLRSSVRLRRG